MVNLIENRSYIPGRKIVTMTAEKEERAIALAAAGWSIKEIRNYLGIDSRAWWEYCRDNPIFDNDFKRARALAMEDFADSLLGIVDEYADVQKARLKSDNIKWLLAKRHADTYGDRVDVNINQQVSITSALSEARARLLPANDQQQTDQPQLIDITPQSDTRPADTESADRPKNGDAEVKLHPGRSR